MSLNGQYFSRAPLDKAAKDFILAGNDGLMILVFVHNPLVLFAIKIWRKMTAFTALIIGVNK